MLINKAANLRALGNLPEKVWPEIYSAAGYLLNRTPTKSLGWKTPFEARQIELGAPKLKPVMSHIYTYGSKAYAFDYSHDKLDKLLPKAWIGYLVGYQSTNIFRVWFPSRKTVISVRDVTFDESQRFSGSEEEPLVAESIIEAVEVASIDDDDLQDYGVLPRQLAIGVHPNFERSIDAPGDTVIVDDHLNTQLPTPGRTPTPEPKAATSGQIRTPTPEPEVQTESPRQSDV
jgi:hypothetical protein